MQVLHLHYIKASLYQDVFTILQQNNFYLDVTY
jgi:hypothetical protein